MRDNITRRLIKVCARWIYAMNTRLNRALTTHLLGAPPRLALTGRCKGCGQCCESPSIAVGRWMASMPLVRGMFVSWQRHINGFELVRTERSARILVFSCTHYDPVTRQCDSYDSRPGMCRDYPLNMLDQDAPALFEACTYTLSLVRGDALAQAIDEDDSLTPQQRDTLKQNLSL